MEKQKLKIVCPKCGTVSEEWKVDTVVGTGNISFLPGEENPEMDFTPSHAEMYCPECTFYKEGELHELSDWVKSHSQ